MFQSRLVGRIPDIGKADARMEAVEHDKRQADMSEHRPHSFAVELVSLVETLRRLVGESVEEPHADVGDEEEHYELPAWLGTPQLSAVGAATEAVHYQRCLNHYLHHLQIGCLLKNSLM